MYVPLHVSSIVPQLWFGGWTTHWCWWRWSFWLRNECANHHHHHHQVKPPATQTIISVTIKGRIDPLIYFSFFFSLSVFDGSNVDVADAPAVWLWLCSQCNGLFGRSLGLIGFGTFGRSCFFFFVGFGFVHFYWPQPVSISVLVIMHTNANSSSNSISISNSNSNTAATIRNLYKFMITAFC